MANARRLVELSMVPELAKEVAAQMESGSLEIGTTSTTAMAGNRVPTSTIRGGVLLQPAVTTLTGTVGTANDAMTTLAATTAAGTGADTATLPTKASVDAIITAANNNLADLQAKVNAILTALRAAGIVTP